MQVCAAGTSTAQSPCSETDYAYATGKQGHNFTGYPSYSTSQQDEILEKISGDNAYNYISTITHNKTKTVTTYNHFHLLVKRETYVANNTGSSELVQEKVYSYPGENDAYKNKSFPANYQTPKQVTTTYHRLLDGKGDRVQVVQMEYNDYGQPILKQIFSSTDTKQAPIQSETMCYDVAGSACISSGSSHYGLLLKQNLTTADGYEQSKDYVLTNDNKNIEAEQDYGKSPSQSTLQLLKSAVFTYNGDNDVASRTVRAGSTQGRFSRLQGEGDTAASVTYSYHEYPDGNAFYLLGKERKTRSVVNTNGAAVSYYGADAQGSVVDDIALDNKNIFFTSLS